MPERWPRVVLASANPGKIAEFRALLEDFRLQVIPQVELGISSAEETAPTFIENALLKARHAAERAQRPALADDSGLTVEALAGAPGIYSSRYAGPTATDTDNIERLLNALGDRPPDARRATFLCVIVMLRGAHDPDPLIATGRWSGRILDAPRGSGGFGYDPVFLPEGYRESAAELTPEVKNRLSHRGQAVAELRAQLAGSRGAVPGPARPA